MNEEKEIKDCDFYLCSYCQLWHTHDPKYMDSVGNKTFCRKINNCPIKQLQTAKEENERLTIKLKLKTNSFISERDSKNIIQKRWNEDVDTYEAKVDTLTQQNKQMREALERISRGLN